MEEGKDCTVSRAVYRIECKTCTSRGENPYVYIGTTGFSIHKRNLEHASKARVRNTSNALGKHLATCHTDEEAEFQTTCLSGGIQFNLNRFILEALEIEEARNQPDINVLNSRSEWGGRGLPWLVVDHWGFIHTQKVTDNFQIQYTDTLSRNPQLFRKAIHTHKWMWHIHI